MLTRVILVDRAWKTALRPAKIQCRKLSITPSRPAPITTTAKDAANRLLETFSGSTTVSRQVIDANQLQKLALTLGRPTLNGLDVSQNAPPIGTPVPPGYHLVYFTPNGVESELGADGTDRTFNAPVPFTRRMWAGGRMQWQSSGDEGDASPILRVGDEAEEHTKLVSATPKTSRTGSEMVLVEVDKEIWTPRGLAMVDRRSWIFRPEVDPQTAKEPPALSDANTRGVSEAKDVEGTGGYQARQYRWSPTGLFRFSALTFNGHKIHYNEDWTRLVESHPGLVVHGPLNLICSLDYWRDVHGNGRSPSEITYRALSPLYAGQTYQIQTGEVETTEDVPKWEVLVKRGDVVCMRADIKK
ncbi:unnamed protein product [Clonostachys solani]|uniref:Mesaconyl-C(4)-CoA hydratase n=1 Tax=Clonostachys solani TaxID=160281 RepID=A0A9P0EG04_9HYPO|nr:unnamed protein product [Clonostachys solani]